MSYQIKSTPFFQRMLTTSKKNGQLQKLKEEYERMRDFNDRAIEIKMRQVRLKRLFKEIEEIKESSVKYLKRRRLTERIKTPEEKRLLALVRSKQLGVEYSKMNAFMQNSSGTTPKPLKKDCNDESVRRKLLMAKAIDYGNEISRANMNDINNQPKKLSIQRNMKSMPSLVNNEKLKQRLNYGNSRSSINMTRQNKLRLSKTNATKKPAAAAATVVAVVQPLELLAAAHVLGTPLLPKVNTAKLFEIDPFSAKADAFAYTKVLQMQKPVVPIQVPVEEDQRKRALKRWRMMALTVRHRFDSPWRNCQMPLDQSNDEEYRLRNISNDTDLTLSNNDTTLNTNTNLVNDSDNSQMVSHDDTDDLGQQTDVFEDAITNEVLLNVESLNALVAWNTMDEMNAATTSDQPDEQAIAKRNYIGSEKVAQLTKIFEPFVREAAQKEAYDGVEKLKSIFEHQSASE